MPLSLLDHMECPSCGANLEHVTPEIWTCPYCGAKYKDDSAKPVQTHASPVSPAPKQPSATHGSYAKALADAIAHHTISTKAKHVVIGAEAVMQDSYKYMRAKANLSIPESACCYLLYSDSLYGFDKGFALCDTGMYIRPDKGPDAENAVHIPWQKFSTISLLIQGNRLCVGENSLYIYEETGANKLLSLLQNIKNQLKMKQVNRKYSSWAV